MSILKIVVFSFLLSNLGSARERHVYNPSPGRRQAIEFNYRYAYENPHPEQVPVRIDLSEEHLNSLGEEPFVIASYFELRHNKTWHEQTLPVEMHEGYITFRLRDLTPENIYWANFKFYKRNAENNEVGDFLFAANEYYGVTSGESDASKARHQIVTVALVEAHDWRVGKTSHQNARYNTAFGNGWCGIFQKFCFNPFSKAFDYTRGGDEPSQGFRSHSAYIAASFLPAYAAAGPIHGSYGARGAHKFMILGYSLDDGTVFSLDGNFNNSVRISQKTLRQMNSFGLINDEISVPENLTVFPAASSRTLEDIEREMQEEKTN